MYNFDPETLEAAGDYTEREITYDGVIKIGNTNNTLTTDGMAYNLGLWSYINTINFEGGIGGDYESGKRGYYIEFIEYDGRDAEEHSAYTVDLIEEDRVFAIVGQISEAAVAATLDYIKYKGTIFVGASCGSDKMFYTDLSENSKMSAVFPVHPTGRIQGAYMVKSILDLYPDCEKIGIINSGDPDGDGIGDYAAFQLDVLNMTDKYVVVDYDWDNYSVDADKLSDCDVVIVAAGRTNSEKVVASMLEANLAIPVLIGDMIPDSEVYKEYSKNAPVYATVWFDTGDAEDYVEFMNAMAAYGVTTMPDGEQYLANRYAMEGWIVADVFCEGLRRIAQQGDSFTKQAYIHAMESEPIKIKMTNEFVNGYSYDARISYYDGVRLGTLTMGLVNADFEQVFALEDITPRVN